MPQEKKNKKHLGYYIKVLTANLMINVYNLKSHEHQPKSSH